VPLPLGLGFVELPVVGDVPGVAELAAGSPVVDPRPLGAPPCAHANVFASPRTIVAVANAIPESFMAAPCGRRRIIPARNTGSAAVRSLRLPSSGDPQASLLRRSPGFPPQAIPGLQQTDTRTSRLFHFSATDLKRSRCDPGFHERHVSNLAAPNAGTSASCPGYSVR